jgi:hypothetical protein
MFLAPMGRDRPRNTALGWLHRALQAHIYDLRRNLAGSCTLGTVGRAAWMATSPSEPFH